MKKILFITAIFSIIVVSTVLYHQGTLKFAPGESKSNVVDRIGKEYELIKVYADGFSQLKTKHQLLAYYLYRAGMAGRDPYIYLNHRHSPAILQLIETILPSLLKNENKFLNETVTQEHIKTFKNYAAIFYINGCQYNSRSKTKYTLDLGMSQEEGKTILLNMLVTATNQQAADPNSTFQAQIEEVSASLFDENFEPIWFSADPSTDFILQSHVNFYDEGVTTEQVTVKDEAGKPIANSANQVVNSRIGKTENGIIEQVYSIEDSGPLSTSDIPKTYGTFSDSLKRVNFWLDKAKQISDSKQQQETLGHYMEFFRTGIEEHFWHANRSWIKDHDFTIDFTLGWVEQYNDPLRVKGSWQISVAYVDPELNKLMQGLVNLKAYFEEKMPWPNDYKLPSDQMIPPKVDVHMLVHQGGRLAGTSTIGINLPNNAEIRQTLGSKNMLLQNKQRGL